MFKGVKNYQAYLVKRVDYEKNYDKDEHIGLKILKTDESNITEELNIYLLKNLKTGEYNFKCIVVENTNDKYTKQVKSRDVILIKDFLFFISVFMKN